MGSYGGILSKDAISHERDKGIPNDGKRQGREMITENQKDYILDLYKDIDIEPIEDLEELTKQQASELIQELIEIKEEMN